MKENPPERFAENKKSQSRRLFIPGEAGSLLRRSYAFFFAGFV